ncbi:MAG: hypothetical protein CSA50_03355 [Gammaproteobacteria bacterium]|nr:MAG: hypothetical protein CSA50_03355 [Gammaproteobacteria bacterium]
MLESPVLSWLFTPEHAYKKLKNAALDPAMAVVFSFLIQPMGRTLEQILLRILGLLLLALGFGRVSFLKKVLKSFLSFLSFLFIIWLLPILGFKKTAN